MVDMQNSLLGVTDHDRRPYHCVFKNPEAHKGESLLPQNSGT